MPVSAADVGVIEKHEMKPMKPAPTALIKSLDRNKTRIESNIPVESV
jgi:hypothetical protein